WSVGRVQTPTLAMVVEREQAIASFVPENYWEVVATFASPSYQGRWVAWDGARGRPAGDDDHPPERLPADGEVARAIEERVRGRAAVVETVQQQRRVEPPPQLYDLTQLQ